MVLLGMISRHANAMQKACMRGIVKALVWEEVPGEPGRCACCLGLSRGAKDQLWCIMLNEVRQV